MKSTHHHRRPTIKQVFAARDRARLAEELLFPLSMADPRFPSALAEWRNAIHARNAAEKARNFFLCPQRQAKEPA